MASNSDKELSQASYWNSRYTQSQAASSEESYEWFRTFAKLRPFLTKHDPPPDLESAGPRILHLGSGASTLPADLYSLGYRLQTAFDFSPVVIAAMRTKHADLEVNWKVMDVRQMAFPGGSFDVAIDKGMLDAMLNGSIGDPEDEVKQNVGPYIDEVARVLKKDGLWLYVMFRQPHFIRPLLQRDVWRVEVEVLQDESGAFEYFGWVMKKSG